MYDSLFAALQELTEKNVLQWTEDPRPSALMVCRVSIVFRVLKNGGSLVVDVENEFGDQLLLPPQHSDASKNLAQAAKTQFDKYMEEKNQKQLEKAAADLDKKFGKDRPRL